MYKQSLYNIFYPLDDENTIVYNTFTESIVKMDKKTIAILKSETGFDDEIICKKLHELGFLVKNNVDEKKIMELDRAKSVYETQAAIYRILTTTACNAKCFYCYEAGVTAENMSLQTAKDVCTFIENRSKGMKKIQIQWFGGEPLINLSVIDYIEGRIQSFGRQEGIEIYSTMITNGILFQDDLIYRATKVWKIRKVQISLDGQNKEYAKRKGISEKENTLQVVIHNIRELLLNGIKVTIRLNYDKFNLESIKKL